MQSSPSSPFLEQWLRHLSTGGGGTATAASPPLPNPSTARAILQSWSNLRANPTNPDLFVSSLRTLLASHSSLHVSDPQAQILLSALPASPPPARPLLLKLLSVWARRSLRPSPSLLESAAKLVSDSSTSCPEEVLLLGVLSAAPGSDSVKRVCLERLCWSIESGSAAFGSSTDAIPELLAGVGYALSKSKDHYFSKIVGLMLRIWNMEGGPPATVESGLMVMGLVEWLVMGLVNSRSMDKIQSLCKEVSVEKLEVNNYARFAVVMLSAGVLRAYRRVAAPSKRVELTPRLRDILVSSISYVGNHVVSRVGKGYRLDDDFESHLIVQCISLGLARCGPFPFDSNVLRCICFALLNDVVALEIFGERVFTQLDGNLLVKEHLNSVLFKEAGAISGVLCNQYALADEDNMTVIENYMWEYSRNFYLQFRVTLLMLRGRMEGLLRELEKVAESVFLMVVVFAAEVNKKKMDPKLPHAIRSEVAVQILAAFSCVEYFRRVRWPEYTDVVRRAVLTLQEDTTASTVLVQSMPSYDELINKDSSCFIERMKYVWSEDEMQTARVLFYMRVIPTCIGYIPGPVFAEKFAPTMFLYMCHPNEKVSKASHSIFVAFVSYGKDADSKEEMELKERLVFYYMERALGAYPDITPYEGMVAGVAALVRHLPAGSPAIFYCISSLVEKATDLLHLATMQDTDLWKNWKVESESCKKLFELLLRLLSLVDIQVLPHLLKLLAQFIVQLPNDGKMTVLDDIFSVVLESDDVIRKPALVSWLQSLSYLSSQIASPTGTNKEGKNEPNNGSISLNRTHSRL